MIRTGVAGARNQLLFREVNERIAELTGSLVEEGARLFVCECSDQECAESVEIAAGEYEAVRRYGARFVVAAGHESRTLERVISENARFVVVEKLADDAAVAIESDPRRR